MFSSWQFLNFSCQRSAENMKAMKAGSILFKFFNLGKDDLLPPTAGG